MSNESNVIDIATQAIDVVYYGDFKERFEPCFEKVKNNADMLSLVGNIWKATNKRFPVSKNPADIIARYPALLTSFILVANHYEILKDTNANHLSALAHATYYLTNGVTNDMVELFGDGLLIDKIDAKVDPRHNEASARQIHTLNAMGNFLKQYYVLKQNQDIKAIRQHLNNYIDGLTSDEVKHLEPMYQLSAEDFELVYDLLCKNNFSGGGSKHENRRL